jgi:hypothetical protein
MARCIDLLGIGAVIRADIGAWSGYSQCIPSWHRARLGGTAHGWCLYVLWPHGKLRQPVGGGCRALGGRRPHVAAAHGAMLGWALDDYLFSNAHDSRLAIERARNVCHSTLRFPEFNIVS